MHAAREHAKREHNQRVWLAWHIAALNRVKKLPTLKSLFLKERPPAQSWREQASIMQQWAGRRDRMLKIISEGNANG